MDIGVNEEFEQEMKEAQASQPEAVQKPTSVFASGKGHVLSEPTSLSSTESKPSQQQVSPPINLLPEPPVNQTEGVCTVQIRGDGAASRRRFDVNTATMKDLFAFAASLTNNNADMNAFRLVTRFPRRVFTLEEGSSAKSLADCDITAGQEMFMLERI